MTAETDISGLYGETDIGEILFAILFWGGVGLVCLSPFMPLIFGIYNDGCECTIVKPKKEINSIETDALPGIPNSIGAQMTPNISSFKF